jgi:hypothetical protein
LARLNPFGLFTGRLRKVNQVLDTLEKPLYLPTMLRQAEPVLLAPLLGGPCGHHNEPARQRQRVRLGLAVLAPQAGFRARAFVRCLPLLRSEAAPLPGALPR